MTDSRKYSPCFGPVAAEELEGGPSRWLQLQLRVAVAQTGQTNPCTEERFPSHLICQIYLHSRVRFTIRPLATELCAAQLVATLRSKPEDMWDLKPRDNGSETDRRAPASGCLLWQRVEVDQIPKRSGTCLSVVQTKRCSQQVKRCQEHLHSLRRRRSTRRLTNARASLRTNKSETV